MTIIVGVLCNNGLVIASDSQAQSFRGVETKRMDYLKIRELCNEKDSCLVATGAGVVAFITKSIDRLAEKLRKEKLSTMHEVAEEAENVMTELERRYSVEKSEKLGLAKGKTARSPRALQEHFPHFSIMIGGKFPNDDSPSIYVVGMDGVAERAEKFDSLGSGSAYAEYLLAKFYRDSLTIEQATTLAVYVVEEVKKIDPGCGGNIQAVSVENGKLRPWNPKEIAELISEIETRDRKITEMWWDADKMKK